jgi:hypothetical protein
MEQTHRDLVVWKKAMQLADLDYLPKPCASEMFEEKRYLSMFINRLYSAIEQRDSEIQGGTKNEKRRTNNEPRGTVR